jgi:hypothetical protein
VASVEFGRTAASAREDRGEPGIEDVHSTDATSLSGFVLGDNAGRCTVATNGALAAA